MGSFNNIERYQNVDIYEYIRKIKPHLHYRKFLARLG